MMHRVLMCGRVRIVLRMTLRMGMLLRMTVMFRMTTAVHCHRVMLLLSVLLLMSGVVFRRVVNWLLLNKDDLITLTSTAWISACHTGWWRSSKTCMRPWFPIVEVFAFFDIDQASTCCFVPLTIAYHERRCRGQGERRTRMSALMKDGRERGEDTPFASTPARFRCPCEAHLSAHLYHEDVEFSTDDGIEAVRRTGSSTK
jgi:hypothetical protein